MTTDPVSTTAHRFQCHGCGADLHWEPGITALKCPHCGTVRTVAPSEETIREKPVEAALRAPRDLGWGAERKVIVCRRCGAHTTIEPHVAATSCAFCGTAAVVEAPANPNVVRPEGLLPFRIPRQTAVHSFREWLSTLWLRPNDLTAVSRTTGLAGAYIPFWTFDANTDSDWTADAGFYYYVPVQAFENGRPVTRQERRVRWEPAAGSLPMAFDDVPVPASLGIDPGLCREIEPFPTADLTPYDPSYLSGFLAEENAVDLPDALAAAKERMNGEIHSACASRVPGDTQRNLAVETIYSALAYKNALLPIWIAAYDYRGKPYRYLVNGVTGKCTGTAPWSWVKVTLLVLTLLTIAIVVLYAMGRS